jgi:hypothetical protein
LIIASGDYLIAVPGQFRALGQIVGSATHLPTLALKIAVAQNE